MNVQNVLQARRLLPQSAAYWTSLNSHQLENKYSNAFAYGRHSFQPPHVTILKPRERLVWGSHEDCHSPVRVAA